MLLYVFEFRTDFFLTFFFLKKKIMYQWEKNQCSIFVVLEVPDTQLGMSDFCDGLSASSA